MDINSIYFFRNTSMKFDYKKCTVNHTTKKFSLYIYKSFISEEIYWFYSDVVYLM